MPDVLCRGFLAPDLLSFAGHDGTAAKLMDTAYLCERAAASR